MGRSLDTIQYPLGAQAYMDQYTKTTAIKLNLSKYFALNVNCEQSMAEILAALEEVTGWVQGQKPVGEFVLELRNLMLGNGWVGNIINMNQTLTLYIQPMPDHFVDQVFQGVESGHQYLIARQPWWVVIETL